MIVVVGSVQAEVRIDMSMPKSPEPGSEAGGGISPWEQEAYGAGGRFGSMQMMPPSDPAKDRISVRFAGCGYNVAKLLAGKGRPVAFVSVTGQDPLGLAAAEDLRRAGVDTSQLKFIDEFVQNPKEEAEGPDAAGTVANGLIRQSLSSLRVVAKNFLGDTEFWREDGRMREEITPEQIASAREMICRAQMVLADGSLPARTLQWIAETCGESGVPCYLDPASVSGGQKAAEILGGFHGIMPGRMEAEAMSGLQILSTDELMAAGAYFAEKGVSRIVITMKGGGLYYKEGAAEEVLRPDRVLRFSETVGAGDVVTAALLDAYAEGKDIPQAARQAMEEAAAYLADCVDERRY